MRGGKFLNNPRMAELHAKEAPDRAELRLGRVFDRTPDGKISQRNFGGHEYPRLAHVGDRTGLEMIRTLQQRSSRCSRRTPPSRGPAGDGSGFSPRRRSPGCSRTPLRPDRPRVRLFRDTGQFAYCSRRLPVALVTGGIGRTFKVTSNSWEYTGDGHALALLAGAPC